MNTYTTLTLETPLGPFTLAAERAGLVACLPAESPRLPAASGAGTPAARAHLAAAARSLRCYFDGAPDPWQELALRPAGTEFQQRVWAALRRIPCGGTLSYRELARAAGHPRAARAVGQANHQNPLAILIPCHRVIAADGSLGGYAGGLERKRWLLDHEAGISASIPSRTAASTAAFTRRLVPSKLGRSSAHRRAASARAAASSSSGAHTRSR